ncbi:MAG: universal stress protein [bacterium]
MLKERKKERKKVFTIIDMENRTQEQKQNTIDYAINLSKVTARDLVFYFLGKVNKKSHKEFIKMVETSKEINRSIYAEKSYMYDIKITYNKEETSWVQSINDIAKKENAAFILMGTGEEKRSFFKKLFGKTMWSIASHTSIPVILIPPKVKFSNFEEITIAVDEENKIQKIKWVKQIYQKFGTKVHVFVKTTGEREKDSISTTVLYNITRNLSHEGISYEIIYAREQKNFEKNLLRYAAKNSQLLIIEVDEGAIHPDVKKNVEKLLFSNNQRFAVMLVKTKNMGIIRWL